MDKGRIPRTDIFIDTPLASKATDIFTRYAALMENGKALDRAFGAPFVHATESVEESKALARFSGFRIIVAASGMCEAGRIRHHLKNHLWQASTTVLLAGFQAEGTLGQILESGAERVTIMGETIAVKAAIRRIEDYSGHADGPELVEWLKERLPIARSVFLTHGEEEAQLALEQDIKGIGVSADCIQRPRLDDVYDLSGETCAFLAGETRRRADPELLAIPDHHQDLASLMLDIEAALDRQADTKARGVLIRRLRRALEGEGGPHPSKQRREFNRRGR
jgi:metallo-beta-lactamase family protein